MARLKLRLDFEGGGAVGPGKITLLEAIRATGSIAAAARQMDMSYRRAWLLVDDMNRLFREPVVVAATGGRKGGGATLSPFGESLVADYRAIQADAHDAVRCHLDRLEAAARPATAPCDPATTDRDAPAA
jgi:molybdate transport system regulatory protein